MKLPSSVDRLLMKLRERLRHTGRGARALATNEYFWAGFTFLLLLLFGFYLLVDRMLLPEYTRHEVAVEVPDVLDQSYEEAEALLAQHDLRAERLTRRFNPELPRDAVIDQEPAGEMQVKPGRRVYLTVNAGETPTVIVPDLANMSLREARNRARALGLEIEEELPDSIPSPHRNTITRQEPESGESVEEGDSLTLWYSTGLGEAFVSVPDVTGMTAEEAQDELLSLKIRSVVVAPSPDVDDEEAEEELVVIEQSRDPGTRVREGFEVRLFLGEEGESPADSE